MYSIAEDLRAARARISNISNFCQRREASSRGGGSVSAPSEVARSWCTLGSVRALPRGSLAREERIRRAESYLQDVARIHYGRSVAIVTDGDTGLSRQAAHSAALHMLSAAAEMAAVDERRQELLEG